MGPSKETLKGSPSSGESREAVKEVRKNGAVAVLAAICEEILRPRENWGCGSSALLYQHAVKQAVMASELQKFFPQN